MASSFYTRLASGLEADGMRWAMLEPYRARPDRGDLTGLCPSQRARAGRHGPGMWPQEPLLEKPGVGFAIFFLQKIPQGYYSRFRSFFAKNCKTTPSKWSLDFFCFFCKTLLLDSYKCLCIPFQFHFFAPNNSHLSYSRLKILTQQEKWSSNPSIKIKFPLTPMQQFKKQDQTSSTSRIHLLSFCISTQISSSLIDL